MKKIIGALCLTAAIGVNAGTVAEAEALYANRDADANNTLKAAQIYAELAQTRTSNVEKAQMKNGEAKALFYYTGNFVTGKKEKLANYVRAYEAADVAVQAMSGATSPAEKTLLAESLYNYSANLGKWGETKGIFSSLGKWPELKRKTLAITQNDETVAQYGAYRILGKGFIKVPTADNDEGYAYLEKAYNNTQIDVNGITATTNIANLTYLVWASKDQKKEEDFCMYYGDAADLLEEINNDPSLLDTYFPTLKPETQTDLEETVNDSSYVKYYNKKC